MDLGSWATTLLGRGKCLSFQSGNWHPLPLRSTISLELLWWLGLHCLVSRLLHLFGCLQSEPPCPFFIVPLVLFFLSWLPLTCYDIIYLPTDWSSLLFGPLELYDFPVSTRKFCFGMPVRTIRHGTLWGLELFYAPTNKESTLLHHCSIFGPSLSVLSAWLTKQTKELLMKKMV